MTNVLIITEDFVGSNMGGVGVRYWEIAHVLAQSCNVTLAVPNQTDLQSQQVRLVPFDLRRGNLRPLAEWADVIVTHGFVFHFHPYLREFAIPVAGDLYNPYLLESLVMHSKGDYLSWIPAYEEYLRVQLELLRTGDFFFCASERQRDYWLGMLHAQKRLNPHTYLQDASLRRLIDVVPYGLQEGKPARRKPVLKGVLPGINPDDRLILWAGGVWDWLDPLTPIRAMSLLAPAHPDFKLYFLGVRHPNPVVPLMEMAQKAMELSQELGLYQKNVFFGDWVPYQERESYLAEADLAVLAHPEHIETHFSFRTRMLDCIWAGLPMVVTDGDAIADWVREGQLGMVVPQGDVAAMAGAIEDLLKRPRQDFERLYAPLRQRLRWENVVAPLREFCLNPRFSADKGHYLTEVERISRGKDSYIASIIFDKNAYIDRIIRDKDNYIRQIIRDKDQYIEQIIQDRDRRLDQITRDWEAYLQQVTSDWQAHLERVVADRDARHRQALQELEDQHRQAIARLESELQQYQAAHSARIAELESAYLEKERAYQEMVDAYNTALTQLEKYRNLLPFRIYRAIRRALGK